MAGINWFEEENATEDRLAENDEDPKEVATFNMNGDGDQYIIERAQPWGIFKIRANKGMPLPKDLSGMYTEYSKAEQAIQTYLTNNVSRQKMRPRGEKAKIKNAHHTKIKQSKVANKVKQDG